MIALIDYGAGNVASVSNVLSSFDVNYKITKNKNEILEADKIIFPGVGEASFAVNQLVSNNLFNLLKKVEQPLLGICLGMQLLCKHSDEGDTGCLNVFPGSSILFDSSKIKVPHMGWNNVSILKENKLFTGIKNNEYFYFAHSYYVPVSEFTSASSLHYVDFTASLNKNNYYGVQFHPEKSGEAGVKLIRNFIELC